MNSVHPNRRLSVVTIAFFIIFLLITQSQASAKVALVDNNVDSDSDQDSTSNKGTSGSTSYNDARSMQAGDEILKEQNFGRGEGTIDDWKYFKDIVVDQDKVGSDLTNFPLLISIIDPDLDTDAQTDGDDIAFFDSDGNQLFHEIEVYDPSYDASNAQLIAWVQTDLSSSQDNLIRMKYGNSTMGNQENSLGVWNSNYSGVWHLSEDPSISQILDSTSNNNDGYTSGMDVNDLVVTKIGTGLDFDGINDMLIVNSSVSLDTINDVGTLSLWINWVDSSDGAWQSIMTSTSRFPTNDGFEWAVQNDGDYFFYPWGGHGTNYNLVTNPFTNSQWHYLSVTLDYSTKTVDLYLDGSELTYLNENVPTYWTSLANIEDWIWGGDDYNSRFIAASYDEIRVADNVRSADWIAAEFYNQNDPNTFYSVSTEYNTNNPWSNYKFININHHQVTSDLSNFPVLVSILDQDIKRNAQSNGADLAFFDNSDIQLSHEIETYNPNYNATHAQLVAWVNSDLSSSTNTRLTLKYGNSTMNSQANPDGVWNANYGGVWHLNENPPTSIAGSTTNSNDGTGIGTISSSTGKISGGTIFTDTSGQEISIPNSASLTISNTLTLSAWINPLVGSKWQTIASKGDGVVDSSNPNNEDITFALAIDNTFYLNLVGSGGTQQWVNSFKAKNDWQYVSFTYNSATSTGELYLNGILLGSKTFSGLGSLNTNTNPFNIGYNRVWTADTFDGIIDEVRLSNTVLSEDWIATEYNNQNNPSIFHSVSNEFYYTDPWEYYKSITIDNTKVTGDVNDFPVYLTIIDEDLKTKAQTDGDDIAFFDNSGNQLAHELMSYNPNYSGTEAQLVVWVKSDLSSTVDTEITMKYGDSSIGPQENPSAVWSNNYNNVWHLEEDPSTTAPQIIDSTNNNMGTSLGSMASNDQVPGKLDGSLDFDGDPIIANGDQIDVGNLGSNAWTAVTMEAWVYKHDNGDDRVFSVAPSTATTDSRFALLMNSVNFAARFGTDGTGGTVSSTISGGAYTINTWYHFVATWDAVTEMIYIYVDGVQTGSAAKDGDTISDTTVSGVIGNAVTNDNRFFNGLIDEVRVSYSARSAEWVETEFNNQDSPSTFYSVGTEKLLDESNPATNLNRVFEDPVDNTFSNFDQIDDQGTHSNFFNEQDKDNTFDTLSESLPNTHSLNSAAGSGYMIVGSGAGSSADWRSAQGTISFWIHYTALSSDRPWGLDDNMEIRDSGGNTLRAEFGGTAVTTTTTLVTGKWYFIGVTWNDETNSLAIYLGDENTAPTIEGSTSSWPGSVTGVPLTQNTFLTTYGLSDRVIIGYGDELRYWDIERSTTEIQSDYNKLLNGTESNLRSYYRLDNNYEDIGLNGNDASSSGSPTFSSTTKPDFVNDDSKLDLEVQFLTIPEGSVIDLGIYAGTLSAEVILVDYWNGTDWTNLFSNLSADSWNNISVTNFILNNELTIRFKDGTRTSDTNQDTWLIDAVILTYTNYELEWEHQVQSIDLTKENYDLTIYGSSSNSSESFEIQMWDIVAGGWSTPFVTKIGTTAQWYNYTLTNSNVIGSTMTWRYRGDNETQDNVQTTLNIDYAGIAGYDEVPVVDVSPGPTQYNEGIGGNLLSWDLTDDNPNRYTIYRDDINISSGIWTNPIPISLNIDGLLKGSYTYKLMATDVNNNHVNDSVIVTVLDGTDPIFTLVPNDYQYDAGTIGNQLNWTASDSYFDNYEIYNDTNLVQSGSWSTGVNISLIIDGLPQGVFNYTLTIYDISGNSAIDIVQVTVIDTLSPTINQPSNIAYSEGTSGHEINWIANDVNADTYQIWNATDQITSGFWTDGVPVIYNIDGLAQGSYNFTIIVFDTSGNNVSDTVIVSVSDETPPGINNPIDTGYSEGSLGNMIDWLATDLDPAYYEILINNQLNETFPSWSSGVTITVNIDGLVKGEHNITIIVYDISGNSISDSVLVTVIDTTPPIFKNPLPVNFQYNESTTDNEIEWLISDNHPNTLTIYLDDVYQFSTSWTSGSMIINVDGLGVGTYNYTIVISDKSSYQASHSVIVTVVDATPPNINNPANITYAKNSVGNTIQWIGTELHPDYYTISNDTQQVASGNWISGVAITFNIDGLDVGLFNYTITLFDDTGNQISDLVRVQITAESVFLEQPSNTYYVVDDTGNFLNWTVSDSNPDQYIIYKDGVINKSGTWVSGVQIFVGIDGLTIGVYNYSIFVNDTDSNFITHQLNVTVSDMPLWGLQPGNVAYFEGTVGNTINWTATDDFQYTYVIYKNGSYYDGGSWSNSVNITVNIDGLEKGVYNFTIVLFDRASVDDTIGNSIIDISIVTVIDNLPPVLSTPADIQYVEGTPSHMITWSRTDSHPSTYEIWNSTHQIIPMTDWLSNGNLIFDVTGLDKGIYNFTIIIYDTSDNYATDTVIVTVIDGTYPIFTTIPDDLQYNEGTASQTLTWISEDIYAANYTLFVNGTPGLPTSWSSSVDIIINLDGYGLTKGSYNFTIVIIDQSGNSIKDTAWVTIVDTTDPTFSIFASNLIFNEGEISQILTWRGVDTYNTTYEIYDNGGLIDSGNWITGIDISINVSAYLKGTHTFTITIYDASGNFAVDVASITVNDGTNPTISNPADEQFSEGGVGPIVEWSAFDKYYANYEIYDDVGLLQSGSWDNTNNITLDLDALFLLKGVYNYTITVYDISGNSFSDLIRVDVIDSTLPVMMNTPSNSQYAEGNTGNALTWDATDGYANNYEIWNETNLLINNTWTSGVPVIYNIDGLVKGLYNFTILFNDQSNNKIVNTVLFTITDETLPLIDQPSDFTYQEGEISQIIIWSVSDKYANYYEILNGSNPTPIDSGFWTNGTIMFDASGSKIGTYLYTLFINDTSGNFVNDTVSVQVIELVVPLVGNSPIDFSYSEESTGNTVFWNATDGYPGIYRIYLNDEEIQSNTWDNSTNIVISVDGLAKGSHNYTIIFEDSSFNFASDTVIIDVLDDTAPSVDVWGAPLDNRYTSGTTGNTINWTVTDNYPDTYDLYIDEGLSGSNLIWQSGVPISLSIDGLSEGQHNYTIILIDLSGNFVKHTILITVSDFDPPNVVNAPPQGVIVTVVEGNSYIINLIITDDNPGNFTVTGRNVGNSVVFSFPLNGWVSNSIYPIPISGLIKGNYNFVINITDSAGNFVIRSFPLEVVDRTNPTFSSEPIPTLSYIESGPVGSSSWTMSDNWEGTWELYQNGTLLNWGDYTEEDNNQWFSGVSVVLTLDGFESGNHYITFVIFDQSNNNATSSILLTVFDEQVPVINTRPILDSYNETTTNNMLIWNVSDLHPENYTITLNGEFYANVNWLNNIDININIDGLEEGTHIFKIIFYDLSLNYVNDTVTIDVHDVTSPVFINPQEDRSNNPFILDTPGTNLEWSVFDLHPGGYVLKRGDKEISRGTWSNSKNIIVNIDGLEAKFYNFTIVISDKSGNSAIHWVMIRIKDPQIMDTIKPEIVLETKVYEGDVEIFDDIWRNTTGAPVPEAQIVVQLVFNSEVIYQFATFSNIYGEYSLIFNYSSSIDQPIFAGQYQWILNFTRIGYQDWQDITVKVTVLPHTYSLEFDVPPKIVQDKEYLISVTVRYNNNNSNSDQLSLSELIPVSSDPDQDFRAQGVIVRFIFNLEYTDGGKTLIQTVISDENGIALIRLTGADTHNLLRVISIEAWILEGDTKSSLPLIFTFDISALPEVVPGSPDIFALILDFVENNVIVIPIAIVLIIASISLSIVYSRRSQDRAKQLNRDVKSAFVELRAIKSIQSIIIQNDAKATVYEEQISGTEMNINLIGGMVTAFSSFLNELGKSDQSGFEMMEREGISITAHKGKSSIFIVISSEKLPFVMLNQIQRAQQAIESAFRSNFNIRGEIRMLNKKQVHPKFDLSSFKVSLKYKLSFNGRNIRNLLKEKSLSRALKQNIEYLVKLPSTEFMQDSKISLENIVEFYKSKGITERVSSRTIILAYQYNIFEAILED